jgi:uncharacterized membrane protein
MIASGEARRIHRSAIRRLWKPDSLKFAGTMADRSLPRLLSLGVFGLIFASIAFMRRDDALDLWWQSGAPTALIGLVCGVTVYALTAVYGRVLAIAVVPTIRW